MGWKKIDFIKRAYRKVGIADYVFDLEPGEIDEALSELDTMMAEWDVDGVRVGYPLTSSPDDSSVDTEFDVPLFATRAMIYNLAVALGAAFGKVVLPETKSIAKTSLSRLYALFIDIPERQTSRRMPLGEGNKRGHRGAFRGQFFHPVQQTPPSEVNVTVDDV